MIFNISQIYATCFLKTAKLEKKSEFYKKN